MRRTGRQPNHPSQKPPDNKARNRRGKNRQGATREQASTQDDEQGQARGNGERQQRIAMEQYYDNPEVWYAENLPPEEMEEEEEEEGPFTLAEIIKMVPMMWEGIRATLSTVGQILLTILGIFIAISIPIQFLYAYSRPVYPAEPIMADCYFDKFTGNFVHCKRAEDHNKQLLRSLVDKARETNSIAEATVDYVLALAMRRNDATLRTYLEAVLSRYLRHYECIKLIDVDSINFQRFTPMSLCAEAKTTVLFHTEAERGEVLNPEKVKPLEEIERACGLFFLMAMYGSEFHEGTLQYSSYSKLKLRGIEVETPPFSQMIYNFYHSRPCTHYHSCFGYDFCLNKYQVPETPMDGAMALSFDIYQSLANMRRCNPPPKNEKQLTWSEYHLRAVFNPTFDDYCTWPTTGNWGGSPVSRLWWLVTYHWHLEFYRMVRAGHQGTELKVSEKEIVQKWRIPKRTVDLK